MMFQFSSSGAESGLEDDGLHVFEWWGGEYRPLEELIAEMDEVKPNETESAYTGDYLYYEILL